MLKNISWTMSNLCNGVQANYWDRILEALPKFSRLIYYNDEEILKVRGLLEQVKRHSESFKRTYAGLCHVYRAVPETE
jgi:hypothetical protein